MRRPTLDALREALMAAVRAREPFQVVHFDGHGVMPGRAPTPGGWASGMYKADASEGDLVFQKANGAADYVPAGKVAAVLQDARVPLVVLNACQSGAMGKQVEAAVATRLLRAGAASVVAMAYSVYSVAAAEFMTAFYESLFAGDPVSAAVTAGLRRLFEHDQRPSLKGDLALADWMVPVHYHRREVRFTSLATIISSSQPSLEQALNDLHDLPVRQADADATESAVFVGRDWLFLELETALRLQRAVVLHGPGGTGKTELARAFAHWWQVTGGTGDPGWMFWHSFDPGTAIFGLYFIVNEIGQKLFGDEFAYQDQGTRTQLVVAESRSARCSWRGTTSSRCSPCRIRTRLRGWIRLGVLPYGISYGRSLHQVALARFLSPAAPKRNGSVRYAALLLAGLTATRRHNMQITC